MTRLRNCMLLGLVLLLITAGGCSSGRGDLNCDLAHSAQYSQYGDAQPRDIYSLRCAAQGSQVESTTSGD